MVMLLGNSLKSLGMYTIAMYQTFDLTRGEAVTISMTLTGCFYGFGVLSGNLVPKFGYRRILLLGNILTFLGLFLSYFAWSATHLILTFGILQGSGVGLAIIPNVSIISRYFDKHKGKANGILYAGGSFGAFVLPPFIEYLLEEYGTSGTFLIMSGLNLNTLAFTCLIHDPPTARHRSKQIRRSVAENCEANVDATVNSEKENRTTVELLLINDNEKINAVELKAMHGDAAVNETDSDKRHSNGETVLKDSNLTKRIGSLLKNGMFYLIILGGSGEIFSLASFYTTFPDHVLTLGIIRRNAAFLLSIASTADFFGRLAISCIIDTKFLSVRASYTLSLTFSGIFAVMIAATNESNFVILCIQLSCFTITYGSCYIHRNIIICQYLGSHYIPTVLSAGMIYGGVLTFSSASVASHFYSITENYSLLYYTNAALFIAGAVAWVSYGIIEVRKGWKVM
ncbi:Uncharacterised protein g9072 [Pycnogonum litorale]